MSCLNASRMRREQFFSWVATFAAIRLQKLVGLHARRLVQRAPLTPRVLRLLSVGHQVAESAQLLGLGEETVRAHLKKAQNKLGVRNRTTLWPRR
jgi:DNA-binding CsgD family transcriptional regulator